jgi:hypothetical protein
VKWKQVKRHHLAAGGLVLLLSCLESALSHAYQVPCNCTQSECECCWQRGGTCWAFCFPWAHCRCTVSAENAYMVSGEATDINPSFRVVQNSAAAGRFGVTNRLTSGTGYCPAALDSTGRFGLIYVPPDSAGSLPLNARTIGTAYGEVGTIDSLLINVTTVRKSGTGVYEAAADFPTAGASDKTLAVFRGRSLVALVPITNLQTLSCSDWPSFVHTVEGVDLLPADTTTVRSSNLAPVVGDRLRIIVTGGLARRLVRSTLEAELMASYRVVGAEVNGPTLPAASRPLTLLLLVGLSLIGTGAITWRAKVRARNT